MTPDKFDILQKMVKQESLKSITFDGEDNITFSTLYMMMEIASAVYSEYNERLTVNENIENYLNKQQ